MQEFLIHLHIFLISITITDLLLSHLIIEFFHYLLSLIQVTLHTKKMRTILFM